MNYETLRESIPQLHNPKPYKFQPFNYGEELINKLDRYKQKLHAELMERFYKKKPLTQRICQLPSDLQKRIYMFSLKKFYKRYDGVIPIYYRWQQYLWKETFRCWSENVHFIHLEYNTIPESKQYIYGCQCDFCKQCRREYSTEKLEEAFQHYLDTATYYLDNQWNDVYFFFNPLYNPVSYCSNFTNTYEETPKKPLSFGVDPFIQKEMKDKVFVFKAGKKQKLKYYLDKNKQQTTDKRRKKRKKHTYLS